MILSLIVAHTRNFTIGRDGGMPWHLPADLAHFKKTTMGSPVLMGRKTFESIGRPLPGRLNIVITGSPKPSDNANLRYVKTAEEAVKAAEEAGAKELFVIGGGSVYRQFIDRADRLYITLIDADIEGDTTFPEYDTRDYEIIASEHVSADEKNACDMDFITYEKIKK